MLGQKPGPGLGDLDFFDHDQAFLANQFGQDRCDRAAVHLAVDLDRMVARRSREGPSAAAPERAANRAGSSIARALLLPRLAAADGNGRTVFLGLGAGTSAGQVRNNDLMDQRLGERPVEYRLVDRDLAASACDCEFHADLPSVTT